VHEGSAHTGYEPDNRANGKANPGHQEEIPEPEQSPDHRSLKRIFNARNPHVAAVKNTEHRPYGQQKDPPADPEDSNSFYPLTQIIRHGAYSTFPWLGHSTFDAACAALEDGQLPSGAAPHRVWRKQVPPDNQHMVLRQPRGCVVAFAVQIVQVPAGLRPWRF